MSSSAVDARFVAALRVEVTDDALAVGQFDGRSLSVPLVWYPRLVRAKPAERQAWRLTGGGTGIHWPALDEDVSVENMLAGKPSAESPRSLARWIAGGRRRASRR